MDYFLLIIIFFLFSLPTNAQIDTNTSITQTSWFWPLVGIGLTLLIGLPCIIIILVVLCYGKHKLIDDSDESSITSNSSSGSVQHERRHRHTSHHRSHYAGGFRSPPPPYTTSELPQTLFLTPSLPPSYESHANENIPTDPSTVTNAQITGTLDLSATLTNQSIETFHV